MKAGMLDRNGNLPEIEKPMMADALSTSFAALLGTSTFLAVGLLPAVWDALLDKVVERPERGPLEIESAREILVEADPPLRLQYDGDAIDCMTPFGARVLPAAARAG